MKKNKEKQKKQKVFSFKITLDGSNPRVWRRILVPADYSFFDLHSAIQNAMGWWDSHLHQFQINLRGKEKLYIDFPYPEAITDYRENNLDETKEKIADYFGKTIKKCIYLYDFGDSWEHIVLFEGESEAEAGKKYPICVDGKGACPFEDSGSNSGYQEMLQIMKDPKHKEHEDVLGWIENIIGVDPQSFDPKYFNPSEVEFEDPKERLEEYEDEMKLYQ